MLACFALIPIQRRRASRSRRWASNRLLCLDSNSEAQSILARATDENNPALP